MIPLIYICSGTEALEDRTDLLCAKMIIMSATQPSAAQFTIHNPSNGESHPSGKNDERCAGAHVPDE